MALLFHDGDYIPNGKGGFCTVTGDREVLERVLWKLSVRRGSFPFLPKLGSRLHLLCSYPAKEREALAGRYVREALSDEDLSVTAVTLTQTGEGRGELTVSLVYEGQEMTAAMEVGGLT